MSKNKIINIDSDKAHEKCGVVAVWDKKRKAASLARRALNALQHRGQESAGLSIYKDSGVIETKTGMGLIPNVLTNEAMEMLGDGLASIAHNRYSTAGSSCSKNAQPIALEDELGRQISIGHNGNIPEYEYLGEGIKGQFSNIESDTQMVASLLLAKRRDFETWDETLIHVLPKIKGAFCFVILTSDGTIYGARDPYGIRPFCLGRFNDGWIMASESVALDLINAEFVRDVKPGEIIMIDREGKISSTFFGEVKRPQNCLFEYIYFSRPDSFENGIRVRNAREIAGKLLGRRIKKKGINADMIVPVFDSGYPAAKGVAQALGLPIVDAITVSHYVGRTFIQPGQESRVRAVSGKFNIVPDEIINKRIIVVDDSAVRLTTSKRLFDSLKEAGAKTVYMVFASPPVVNQCDLGIDMKSKKELPASKWEKEKIEVIEDNVAKLIGLDGVSYLPIEEVAKSLGGVKEDFYHFPFGGPHPIKGESHEFKKMKRRISDKPKIMVFVSGNGTNLQEIIDQVKNGNLRAEICGLITNNPGSRSVARAERNNIAFFVKEYKGGKSKEKREIYEKELIALVKEKQPDIIVLAGWMMLLGEEFLNIMEKAEIPVINLHPALLTEGDHKTVATSRGEMPVIRGTKAIERAFEMKLPVSGVTAHQVLAKNHFDCGPIILKEEVRIRRDQSIIEFESSIHEAERRVLPTAIKRVLHVMKDGVAITKGDFYW